MKNLTEQPCTKRLNQHYLDLLRSLCEAILKH